MRLNSTRSALLVAALVVTLVPLAAGQAPQSSEPAAAPAKPVYDESADGASDIAAALARAKLEGTRVLIVWGANWCGWCTLFHRACNSRGPVADTLREEYRVVRVDIGRGDKHQELAAKYRADFKNKGVPYLTVLDSSGAVLANQETGPMEMPEKTSPRGHDQAKVLAFLKQHQAPPLNADEVLAAGLAAAKSQDKMVFLHFGAPWCGWCVKLDDWMSSPEIAEILAEAFVNVKIDTKRMTGGQAMLDAHGRGKSGGVPWFEFLDADGNAQVNSNGPEGNTGYPAQPAELEWFGQMLRNSGAKLSPEDITALLASLQPKPAGA